MRLSKLMGSTRAQSTNLVGLFIGILIAAIVVIQVFIPVVTDAIASSSYRRTLVGLKHRAKARRARRTHVTDGPSWG
jgi:hypothetical protein